VARLLVVLLAALLAQGCAGLGVAPKGPAAAGRHIGAPESISARAIVEFDEGTRVRGRAAIAVEAPDRFRIEVYGPMGQVAATLVSDGERLLVFSRGKLDTYAWDDPELPYSFTATEVVGVLTGSFQADTPGYATETDADGRVTAIIKRVDRAGPGVLLWETGPSIELRASMADYRDAGGAAVPYAMTIDDGRRRLSIDYTEVETGSMHPPETFSTTP